MEKLRRTARCTKAKIDSFNFASPSILSFFIDNENYSVDKINKTKKEDRQRWFNTFGKPVKNHSKYPWIELYIINSLYGDTVPIKLHNKDRNNYILELAGIENYNTKLTDLVRLYQDVESSQTHAFIKRMDICIDYKIRIPSKTMTELKKHRPYLTKFLNTTYYDKSKDKNGKIIQSSIKIRTYNKSKKEHLPDENEDIIRLEFQFPSSFFQIVKKAERKKLTIKDLPLAIKKMEKYIKGKTKLNAKIDISFSKLHLKNTIEKHTSSTENKHIRDTVTESNLQNTSSINNKSDKKGKASKLSHTKKTLDNNLNDNSCTSCQKEIIRLRKEITNLIACHLSQNNKDSERLKRIEEKIDYQIEETKRQKTSSSLLPKKYATTKDIAMYFGIDPSFLIKRKSRGVFQKKKHFVTPPGEIIVRWKIEEMEKWFNNDVDL